MHYGWKRVRNSMGNATVKILILQGQRVCMMDGMEVHAVESLAVDGDARAVRPVPEDVLDN